MSGLNLANFKKMKEDKKTVTMGHPAGHSITILKSKLSALQKEQMKRLPIHAAEGDPDVGNEDDGRFIPGAPTAADVQALPELTSEQKKGIQPDAAPGTQMVASNDPTIGLPNQSYSNSPIKTSVVDHGNDPDNTPTAPIPTAQSQKDAGFSVEGAYAQGQRAISEQQNVASKIAKAQTDIQEKDLDARKDLQDNSQQNLQTFQKHKEDFSNYIANNPINEKHYVENMGTGQKVATAIGLLLGGFTGGFNRTGVNPAADWLNNQIGRDIEGQRARMDQQKTILGANQELYHDQVLANNATRVNLNDIYDRKIQLAANQLGTAAAKAAADAAHSKFALENANLLQNSAIRGAAIQAIKRGGAGLDPITLGQAGFMSPEDARKEQASFDAQKAGIARINDLYEQLNKEQTAGNFLNPQSHFRVAAIKSGIRDAILSTDVNHRLSPEVLNSMLDPNLIDTRDNAYTREVKQNDVLQKIQAHAAGDMPTFARYAPAAVPKYTYSTEDQKAIQWANQNRHDPRSAKILATTSGG